MSVLAALDPDAIPAMRAHAERSWPEEACGVVAGGRYEERANVAADREGSWQMEPEALRGGDIRAIVHSHPPGCEHFPSRADMQCQIDTALPHGIVPMTPNGEARPQAGEPFFWGPGEAPEAYLGRPYRHGVTDCYTLVRDWYGRERGLALPALAYDWRWFADEPELDLYSGWRKRLGWRQVEPAEAEPGDVVLLALMGARVANHAGVLLDGGMLLHHPSARPFDPTCLSRRTPVGRLVKYVVEVARPPEAES